MKINFFLSILLVAGCLFTKSVPAFVPQPEHLLYMVSQKIKIPAGLEIEQTRTQLYYKAEDDGVVESLENLFYRFPGQLRIQQVFPARNNFSIVKNSRYIKVANGMIVSRDPVITDLYTDVLLYRDYESLLNRLALLNIDTGQVSFQRDGDTICYVIGTRGHFPDDTPGLWIEKQTLLPVKYVVEKNGKKVVFLYKNWQKVSKTFYPMQVHIFLDNRLTDMIQVNTIQLKSQFQPHLFHIDQIENQYPEDTASFEPELTDEY